MKDLLVDVEPVKLHVVRYLLDEAVTDFVFIVPFPRLQKLYGDLQDCLAKVERFIIVGQVLFLQERP